MFRESRTLGESQNGVPNANDAVIIRKGASKKRAKSNGREGRREKTLGATSKT